MTTKIPAALLIAALIIAIPGVVGLLRPGHDRSAFALTPSAADSGMRAADERVAFWRSRVVHESDYLNRIQLSGALLEVARQTGDLSAYAEADQVIDEALMANPDSGDALTVAAAVQFGLHEFDAAATTAQQVLADDPTSVQALAVAGDSLLELGRYAEAADTYDRLQAADQGPAVLVRLARLAWNRGDVVSALARAEEALARANEVQLPAPEVAFYALQLATYRFDTGDIDGARALAEAAVQVAPQLPAAEATLGRVVAGTGDLEAAAAHYERAAAIVPRPEYLAALGDLYMLLGQTQRAEEQFDAVEVIGRLAAVEQVVYNRELARFFADHDRELDRAVAMARAELEVRRDVGGYDTLAWALHKAGRTSEAGSVADELAAFGSRDPLVLYHLGEIARAAGDTVAARGWLAAALAANPAFDPVAAPAAAAALADIGGDS